MRIWDVAGTLYRDISLLPIHYFVAGTLIQGHHSLANTLLCYWYRVSLSSLAHILWYTNWGTLVLHIRDLILSRPTVGSLDHRRSLQGIVYCLEGRNGAFNGKMSNVSKNSLCEKTLRAQGVCLFGEFMCRGKGAVRADVPPRFCASKIFRSPTPHPHKPPTNISYSPSQLLIQIHTLRDHWVSHPRWHLLELQHPFPKRPNSSDSDDWKSSRYPFQSLCYSHYYWELMND